ncbi:unnamed protein product [Rangifer tarandus platyrhynchus]|uniref:Uncharacterized protein n=1 Tax=Rangifer tarandus platyrhynchus TaxID=3082113 RepID=A0ABN8ZRU4_RANTA|nr:unnamed protein product [Rangifer tarandus platyrhynchus]
MVFSDQIQSPLPLHTCVCSAPSCIRVAHRCVLVPAEQMKRTEDKQCLPAGGRLDGRHVEVPRDGPRSKRLPASVFIRTGFEEAEGRHQEGTSADVGAGRPFESVRKRGPSAGGVVEPQSGQGRPRRGAGARACVPTRRLSSLVRAVRPWPRRWCGEWVKLPGGARANPQAGGGGGRKPEQPSRMPAEGPQLVVRGLLGGRRAFRGGRVAVPRVGSRGEEPWATGGERRCCRTGPRSAVLGGPSPGRQQRC